MTIVLTDLNRATAHLTTTLSDIFTVPEGKRRKITHIQIGNVDGSAAADGSVVLYDVAKSDTFYYEKTNSIAADAALKPLGDLVGAVLIAGDKLQGQASADGDLDLIVSYAEYTVS